MVSLRDNPSFKKFVEDIVDIDTQDILNPGLVCYHHVCCFHVAFSTGKTVQGALKTAPVDWGQFKEALVKGKVSDRRGGEVWYILLRPHVVRFFSFQDLSVFKTEWNPMVCMPV